MLQKNDVLALLVVLVAQAPFRTASKGKHYLKVLAFDPERSVK
jgi:hypothetical protein